MGSREPARIDLHIHSNASDGTLSPSDIIARACHLDIKAIAITDHDTIDGSKAALTNGIPSHLNFLTGVEISAAPPPSFPISGSFHILGYAIQLDDPHLSDTLVRLQSARRNRNPEIIKRLRKLGADLSIEALHKEFGDTQLGRPHIAQLMIKTGFVSTIDEAFDNYIGKDKPAYVDKYRVGCAETIEIIKGAGGIAVLAHPYLLKIDDEMLLENLFVTLKDMGLGGIEVYYPDHTHQATILYKKLAERLGLVMTGGTDYHGDLIPQIEMGLGYGDFHVPYELYEGIVKGFKDDFDQ